MGQLLDAGQPVLGRVEAGLEQSQREGGEGQHLAAPPHRLLLQLLERHDGVHESHLHGLVRRVLPAEEPDLPRLLRTHLGGQRGGAEAAVEAAHPGPGLSEAGVVGRDREVAEHVEHVAAADRVARHHGHDRLGQAPHLEVQVGHVEAPDAASARLVVGQVAGVSAHALVAAGAEGQRALAGQHDHADSGVLPRLLERPRELHHGLRAEGVAHLGTVDRDLRDAVRGLVADVLVFAGRLPRRGGADGPPRLLLGPVPGGHRAVR